jgi:septal ring factor EnvC (AmiA/AmiB activator)
MAGARSGAPVAGPVVGRFGETTDAGRATGVSYAPPPAALVSAPCKGRIDFAGPFRSYGNMVILDCGGGYRFVLAGLDRIDTQPGTNVRAGQPVGRMPDFSPGAHGRPTLYVQLRRGSDAIDPGRFLSR